MAAVAAAGGAAAPAKRSAPGSPTPRSPSHSGLPVAANRRRDAGTGQNMPPRSMSAMSLASSAPSRQSKARRRNEPLMNEKLHIADGGNNQWEDHYEDLVSLPISDELLPTHQRNERMKEAEAASDAWLASSLVFGIQRAKSAGTLLDSRGPSRQTSLDDLAQYRSPSRQHYRPREMEENLGPAIPGSIAYSTGMLASSPLELTRTSSSQSSGRSSGLAPPLPLNSLSRSAPSRTPGRQGQRSVTAPAGSVHSPRKSPTDARAKAVTTPEPGSQPDPARSPARSRSTAGTTRPRANTGNLTSRKPKTPIPRTPKTPRTHSRARSASGADDGPEMTPPWEASAPPKLYRGEEGVTLSPGKGNYDDMIVPSVSRRLLQEHLEAGDDGLFAEYDKEGRPIRVAQIASPTRPAPAPAPMPEPPPSPVRVAEEKPFEKQSRPAEPVVRTEAWDDAFGKTKATPKDDETHGGGCCRACTIM